MRLFIGLVSAALACAATAPHAFRLPDTARPTRYELEVTIVARQPEFRGVARIWLDLAKPVRSVRLNAKGLTIERVTDNVKGTAGAPKFTVSDEFLDLFFDTEIGPGAARVDIAYHAPLSDQANVGLYRKKSGEDWYAYTTFTPIEARRAFPCFDEPGYKAPWRVILHVPQSDVAASNTRLVSETNEPGGMKRVEFSQTKPMASEVVALAVGPFDVVEAGEAGVNHVPVRILAPRGRGRESQAAKRATAEVLARLEQYTGVPYPWDKLDHLAVLDMPYGAVENPGLITYRDRIILAKPERDTPEHQHGMRATMAHELAHQWFGNLVTQAWWDDVWLSEGFATWLGMKTTDLELPAFERSMAATASRTEVMRVDATADSRPVRLAMNSREEMARVYGGIVYQKGAAILGMVEQWLGPEVFQRGLQRYLAEHALSNATTDDLVAALSRASSLDVGPVLHSFLDQTGYPVVRAQGGCVYELDGASQWTLPLCLHGDDGASQCTVISRGRTSFPTCPAWTWPNRAGAGYFRVRLSPAMLETIMQKGWGQLTPPERLDVVDDTAALVTDHAIGTEEVLRVLPTMAGDSQPVVAGAAYRLLLRIMLESPPQDRERVDAVTKRLLTGRSRR